MLQGKQVQADYFDTNTVGFSISSTEKTYGKFCVNNLQTVDFSMFLTLNVTDSVDIRLTKEGVTVVTA